MKKTQGVPTDHLHHVLTRHRVNTRGPVESLAFRGNGGST